MTTKMGSLPSNDDLIHLAWITGGLAVMWLVISLFGVGPVLLLIVAQAILQLATTVSAFVLVVSIIAKFLLPK